MAVYYKFKSAKDYDSLAIDGHFISLGHFKQTIFQLKHLGRGKDFDLVVTNAQTDQEYLDEGMLIPKNTSVLIRRVPGPPCLPIVIAPVTQKEDRPNVETNSNDIQPVKSSFSGAEPPTMKYAEDFDWDDFGNDIYAIPDTLPLHSSIPVQDAPPVSKEDEDSMIQALIDTPALDWQVQHSNGFGPGRGFGRGTGGRMMGGRGFGWGGFETKTPPQGYICHRCKVAGHFIQHCPTNGDPTYDIKRVRPPTGIPKSMLMATPDGSYALPSGAVAVLKPNEAAFEKEIEGMPSTRSVGDLPPELHCPLCKEVMKYAVFTSKCCFSSFCDKCIRDHIITKSMCVCGATNILADDLVPNKTLRDTITRILESNTSSGEHGGSAFQVQDMESRNPQAMVPSPTQSAASKGLQVPAPPPEREETSMIADTVDENKAANTPQKQENERTLKVPDVSEATHDSRNVREAAALRSSQLVDEEGHQRPVSGEAGKKIKKKKVRMTSGAPDMQWRTPQDFAPENYMMPMGPSAFNPYWNGIQPGFDGFMPPYPGPMPYMGYGLGPMDVAFGGVLPQDPFGGPGCMFPYGPPPQRDLAELAMGFNPGPPIMQREEVEAHKADLKRKREMERHGERKMPRDGDHGREISSTAHASPMKPKSKSMSLPPNAEHHQHSSPSRCSPTRPSSKKTSAYQEDHRHHRHRDYHDEDDHYHHRQGCSELPSEPFDKKGKASVFSRISVPEKKRKMSEIVVSVSTSVHRKAAACIGYVEEHNADSSDDDERHFKRRYTTERGYRAHMIL